MKKIILIVIVIIALIIIGIFIFSFNGKNAGNGEGAQKQIAAGEPTQDYANLQTDNDIFNAIDESLKFLD